MKRVTIAVLLVFSACTIREARPKRTSLVEDLTACLEQNPDWKEPNGLELHVGAAAQPASSGTEQCLQNAVNAAALEARRDRALQIVRVTWLKAEALSDENTLALSNGVRFSITQAWFTPPQKVSGPLPQFNPEGDEGLAIVRCRLPTTGRPEHCKVVKPIRGQNLTEAVEQSDYSPCLSDGEPVECDLVQAFKFRR